MHSCSDNEEIGGVTGVDVGRIDEQIIGDGDAARNLARAELRPRCVGSRKESLASPLVSRLKVHRRSCRASARSWSPRAGFCCMGTAQIERLLCAHQSHPLRCGPLEAIVEARLVRQTDQIDDLLGY